MTQRGSIHRLFFPTVHTTPLSVSPAPRPPFVFYGMWFTFNVSCTRSYLGEAGLISATQMTHAPAAGGLAFQRLQDLGHLSFKGKDSVRVFW